MVAAKYFQVSERRVRQKVSETRPNRKELLDTRTCCLTSTAKQDGNGPQLERPGGEATLVEPSACNLEYIDVDFLLADERWAGTDHQLDLVLHGKFAKSASEPIRLGSDVDRGWHHTQSINLKEEFNAETISFKSIKGLELWSGKDELWVQGASPLSNL